MAMMLEGFLEKRTDSMIKVFQKKYFKVIAHGAYIIYFDKQPNNLSKKVSVPNGVFFIHKVENI